MCQQILVKLSNNRISLIENIEETGHNVIKKLEGTCREDNPWTSTMASIPLQSGGKTCPGMTYEETEATGQLASE
jgi:hypothetical protein